MNGIITFILSADFTKLSEEIEIIDQSELIGFHVDVMDGVFVNLTMGFLVVKQSMKLAKTIRCCTDDSPSLKDILNNGEMEAPNTSRYTTSMHASSPSSNRRFSGAKAGVAINPHTDCLLSDIISDVLTWQPSSCLSIPALAGRAFIPRTFEKLKSWHPWLNLQNASTYIEMDGGCWRSPITSSL